MTNKTHYNIILTHVNIINKNLFSKNKNNTQYITFIFPEPRTTNRATTCIMSNKIPLRVDVYS